MPARGDSSNCAPMRKGSKYTYARIYIRSLSFTACPLFLNTSKAALAKCMHLAEDVFLDLLIYMGVKLL